jgi:phage shock protein PspC (stress-responsive transcriptional regulator)
MQAFLLVNLGMFFLIFLFFSYSSYFSRSNPQAYMPLSPFMTAAGITIGFWVAFEVLKIVNLSLGNAALSIVEFWMYRGLFIIFWIALLLGYLALLVKLVSQNQLRKPTTVEPPVVAAKSPKAKAGRVHRLYRSGNDKILGGVCGGIAEYFAIDPTIIRLLWIVLTLMGWGSGIILYIILWIIVPRNPSHKWD